MAFCHYYFILLNSYYKWPKKRWLKRQKTQYLFTVCEDIWICRWKLWKKLRLYIIIESLKQMVKISELPSSAVTTIAIVLDGWDESKEEPRSGQVDQSILAAAIHSRQNNTPRPKAVGCFFPPLVLMLIMERSFATQCRPHLPSGQGILNVCKWVCLEYGQSESHAASVS